MTQTADGVSELLGTLGIVLLLGMSPVAPLGMVIAFDLAIAFVTVAGFFLRWAVVPELGTFCAGSITLALFGLPSQIGFIFGLAAYAVVWRLRRGRPHRH